MGTNLNEAAERLRVRLPGSLGLIDEALAAEYKAGWKAGYDDGEPHHRRATVERIRVEAHKASGPVPLPVLDAILDEEAAR